VVQRVRAWLTQGMQLTVMLFTLGLVDLRSVDGASGIEHRQVATTEQTDDAPEGYDDPHERTPTRPEDLPRPPLP